MDAVVPFVGLTGGLGAGKSTALAALQRLGAVVLSTDAVVHELYAGERLRDAVVERWGPEVAPAGVVDRSAVAERAFPERRTGNGSRVCCGRSWGRGSRSGLLRCEPDSGPGQATRGGGRDAAAVRGGHGGAVRRDDRGDQR